MISTASTANPAARANLRSEAIVTAPSTGVALELVKRALGEDALIVTSRTVGVGAAVRVQVHPTRAAGGLEAADDLRPLDSPITRRTQDVLERILYEHDVPAGVARALVLRCERSVETPPRERVSVRERLEALLRASVGFGDAALSAQRVIALVGATGVGKTTTIAKLAARDALVHRRRVALVSLDDHRVGGAEHLARYADLIGIPFEVASDAASLRAALAGMSRADRIYVDTAGRAPREVDAHAELASRLAAGAPGVAVALCVAAASRSTELRAMLAAASVGRLAEGPGVLRPRALIVTKLDEAVLVGAAITCAATSGLPIAWLTTGQRVPEDLELATAERLACALMEDR